jgi:hypothetical protein
VALGYQRFSCRCCRRRFNDRTGTPFNDLQFPTDIVLLAVSWRLRYKLGFRDVAELLLQRGYEVTHETVRPGSFGSLLSSANDCVAGAAAREAAAPGISMRPT